MTSFMVGMNDGEGTPMRYGWSPCFAGWEYNKSCTRVGYKPRSHAHELGMATGFYKMLMDDLQLKQFFAPEDVALFFTTGTLEMEYTDQQRALSVMTPFRLMEEYQQIAELTMKYISDGHDPLDSFMVAQAKFLLNGAHTVYSKYMGIRKDYRLYLKRIQDRATTTACYGEKPMSTNTIWCGTNATIVPDLYRAEQEEVLAAFAKLKELRT